jgi:uncharacterized protein YjbI with pentapeptide repeats
MRMTVFFSCLLAWVFAALTGCAEIPADNPYDPNAPVTVQATGAVRGRVLLPAGFAPALLADVRVTLTSQVDGDAQRTVGLDAAGAFTFDEVRPGDWRLVAALDGFGASPALFRVGIGASVDVGELTLSARTGVLVGRVRLRGAPDDGHAGTRVVARETGAQGVTGPDGTFTLGLVARTHTLQLVPPSGFLLPERWRETAVDIVAGETASLSGDEEIWCEPPATYALSGILQSPLPIADWPLRSLVQATGGGVVRVATVTATEDGHGAFQIAGLLPGEYALSALVVGHHALRRDVTLGAADVDVGPLALVPDRADFAGVVVRAGGAPVEGVVVRAQRGAVTAATALTDVEGAFSLLLTPETHALSLSHPDFEPLADVYLDFTEAGFTVRDLAAPPFELQPRPAAALGGPVGSALGALEDWPGRAFATLTSADGLVRRLEPVLDAERGRGRLEFAGLPPGPYTLGVTAQGHLPFSASVDLPAGRSTLGDVLRPGVTPGAAEIDGEIGVRLTPEADNADSAVVLRGRVALAGREDHGGVILRATVGGNLVATSVSDPSGAFAFLTSRATHELGFSREGFAERVETVEWDDAEARFESQDRPLDAVEFTLSPLPTAALVGQLQSPLQIDDWANRAFVTLVSADEAVRRLEPVLRDGGFQFTDLPPGDYRLSVSARGHLPATENVTLVEGENGPVRIALTPEGFDAETATLLVGRVRLADVPDDGDHSDVTVRGRIGGNLVFTTMTDDSGAFLFPVARESHVLTFARNNYQPSAEHVIAWRVDEALPEGGRFEYEGRPLAEVVFSLEPRQTAAVRGRLASPLRIDDWPARALVSLFGDGVQRLATVSQEAGEGRFEAAGLRPGAYTLAVQALGHAPVVRMLELPAEGLDLGTLSLAPQSVPFTAHVVDPDGAPVEGAVIRAERDDVTAATGLSDADGEFTLLLTPETHVLSVSADGFAPLRDVFLDWTPDDRFEVRDLDAPPFVMVPEPRATLEGRVASRLGALDDWPGRAFVTLVAADGDTRRLEPVADADRGHGQFQFTGLEPGPYVVSVTAQGHAGFTVALELPQGENTLADVLDPGAVPGLEDVGGALAIMLEPDADTSGVLLRGTVHLGGRDRHEGVLVQAAIGPNLVGTALTDDTGRFALLTTRDTHDLSLTRAGFQRLDVTASWDEQTNTFTRQGVPLTATALELAPLPTATLTGRLSSPLQVDDWANRAYVSLVSADEAVRRIEPVLREGDFEFVDLPPGDYRLSVSARGHLPTSENLSLVDGANGPVRIALVPEAFDDETSVLMRGTVRLSGVPDDGDHSDVTVRGRIGGNLVFTTVTDASGTFLFPVSRETHVVTFSKSGFQPSPEHTISWLDDAEAPGGGHFEFNGEPLVNVVFPLEPRATAGAYGRLESAVPVADWTARSLVLFQGADVQRIAQVVNTGNGAGTFQVAGLRPGEYSLTIQVQGYWPQSRTVTIDAIEQDLGSFVLVPQEVVYTARVVNAAGQGIEGAVIQARIVGANNVGSAVSDATGEFSLRLSTVDHELSLTRDGYGRVSGVVLDWDAARGFTVTGFPAPPFVLPALPVSTLSGYVASAVGARDDWSARAFVTLVSADGASRRLEPVADADQGHGQFQFAGLVPGNYTLSVVAQGHLAWSHPVVLPQGARDLGAVLDPAATPGLARIGNRVVVLLQPEAVAEQALLLRGRVELAGRQDHGGVLVRAAVGPNLVATALTDAAGGFAFLTSRETHDLTLTRDGFQRVDMRAVWDEAQERFEVAGAALAETPLALPPLPVSTLNGLLRSPLQIDDWPNRAYVVLVSDDGATRRLEPVLEDGSFQLAGLVPGGYTLSVSARGHLPSSRALNLAAGNNPPLTPLAIDLVPEAEAPTAVTMRGVARLSGVAAPPGGNHADIVVRAKIGANLVFTTLTDGSGAFAFPAAREAHVLTLARPGYIGSADLAIGWLENAAEPDGGHFVYNGNPLSGALLTIQPEATATLSGTLRSPLTINDWAARTVIAVVAADGQRLATVAANGGFQVAGLRTGAYSLTIQVQGHRPVVQAVNLPANGINLGIIDLVPDFAPFTATVRATGGAAVEGAIVRARRNGVIAGTAVSDAAGRVDLSLTPEAHDLDVTHPDHQALNNVVLAWDAAERRFEVANVAEPTLTLTPQPVATLTGTVASDLGALNDWAGRAVATLVSADGAVTRVEPVFDDVDGHGQFQFAGLAPGNYTVGLTVRGHQPYSADIALAAGERDLGLITVQADALAVVLRGRVSLAGRAEHGGVLVQATVGNNLVATALTDGDGAFALLTSNDDHTLTFTRDGFVETSVQVLWDEVQARFEPNGLNEPFDGRVTVLPALGAGRITACVLMAPDWIPAGDRGVFVNLLGANAVRTVPAVAVTAAGSCAAHPSKAVFDNLPVGTYRVSVDRPGFSRPGVEVNVTAAALVPPEQQLAMTLQRLVDADLNLAAVGRPLTRADLLAAGDLRGADLRGVDLTGADLNCLDLSNADLSAASMDAVDLTGAVLAGADLSGASLRGARLYPRTMSPSFQYPDFVDASSLTLVGSAALDGRRLALTPLAQNLAGAAWKTTRVAVDGPWETRFSFRMVGGRGEGFAFVVQAHAGDRLGATGAGLGYEGILNSVAIEFDTWTGAAETNHISIHTNGLAANAATEVNPPRRATVALPAGVSLGDGTLHDARITYTPGTLSVYVDDEDTARLTLALNLATTLALTGGSTAWVGFTASTGTETQSHEIHNWSFGTTLAACAGGNRNTDLTRVDFSGADLSGALFTSAPRLRGVACGGARMAPTLTGASFGQAVLTGANLSDVHLAGVSFAGQQLSRTWLQGACLSGAQLGQAELSGASLDLADLTDARLPGALLIAAAAGGREWQSSAREINATGAQLPGALLELADLRGANLTRANLVGADLAGADLTGALAVDATLFEALIGPADRQAVPQGCVLPTETGRPLAFWDFDNDTDDSWSGLHDGVAVGGPNYLVVSGSDYAINLDGVNDYVTANTLAGALATGDGFTLSVRFRSNEVPATDGGSLIFAANTNATNLVFGVGLARNGGIYLSDGTVSGSGYNNDAWHTLRVTMPPGGPATLFVDGAQIGQRPLNPAWSTATRFSIGQEWDIGATDFYQGRLDDLGLSTGCSAERFTECSDAELPPACRRANTRLVSVDFSGASLDGVRFDRADLTNARFQNASLVGAAFSEVTYTGTTYVGADLSEASFPGEDLQNASFIGAILERADFSGSDLGRVRFTDCRWSAPDCNAGAACLVDPTCWRASLAGADLSRTVASSVTPFLVAADLRDANLQGSDFGLVDLSGAEMAGANLTGAAWTWVNMYAADLEGAIATGVTFTLVGARNADFRDARLGGCRLDGNFEGADFSDGDDISANTGADLSNCALGGFSNMTSFDDTDLSGAVLNGVSYAGTVDFSGRTLDNYTICPDGRTHAQFPGCGLPQ